MKKLFIFIFVSVMAVFVMAFSASALTEAQVVATRDILKMENYYNGYAYTQGTKGGANYVVSDGYNTTVYNATNDSNNFYIAKGHSDFSDDPSSVIEVNPAMYGYDYAVLLVRVSYVEMDNNFYPFEGLEVSVWDSHHYPSYFTYLDCDNYDWYYYIIPTSTAIHNIACKNNSSYNYSDISFIVSLEYRNDSPDVKNGTIVRDDEVKRWLYNRTTAPARHNAFYTDYNSAYNSGYSAGQTDGYSSGYTQGQTDGYSSGYDKGQTNGYSTGYDEGYDFGYDEGVDRGKEIASDPSSEIYQNIYKSGVDNSYNEIQKRFQTIFENNSEKLNEKIQGNTGTLTEGFLAGMWNGMTDFTQMILTGVTFSGLSLMNILATLLGIMIAAFVIKMIRG